MTELQKSHIEELTKVGILSIYSKNGQWIIHLQRNDTLGFLAETESAGGENLEYLLQNLLDKVKSV